MLKPELKAKAIALRQQGLSYNEILAQVPVSKSSLSLWLRNIPVDREMIEAKGSEARVRTNRKTKQASKRPEEHLQGHPKWKGLVSETAFVARCVRERIRASIPVGDNTPYDAVVETPEGFKKAQVKTITFHPFDNNKLSVRRTRYRNGRMASETYEDGDFDFLIGYCPERDRFLILAWGQVPRSGRLTVHFDKEDQWTPFLEDWASLR